MLRFPDPPLGDGVITLRAKTPADADALVAACQDPEIPRWSGSPPPSGIDWDSLPPTRTLF